MMMDPEEPEFKERINNLIKISKRMRNKKIPRIEITEDDILAEIPDTK